MLPEHYIRCGKRMLRCGYTTGSCAAMAAAGAAELFLGGSAPQTLHLLTPAGILIETEPELCIMKDGEAFCSVRKDAGDDPDVTDGLCICARIGKTEHGILIEGGEGIGRVTAEGLDQPPGAAAINTVPRRMIREALEAVCARYGYDGGLRILISAPGGDALAVKTFNPQLGIEGGISILGTTGIVEPMSEKAIVDTIATELHQKAVSGITQIILTPGNYGMDFLDSALPMLCNVPRIKCSNYIGEALDLCALEGMEEVLLVGHIGKLVKLAGGIMNTHSAIADCRMELFCAHAALCGAEQETCRKLMEQISTDGCLAVLEEAGLKAAVLESLLLKIQTVLDRRSSKMYRVGAVLFSNLLGELGSTSVANELLSLWGAHL